MNQLYSLTQTSPLLIIVLLVWSLFWKSLALWRAAKNKQRYWFVGILIVNTFGIAELIYLFRFAKDKLTLEDLRSMNLLP